MQRVVLFEDAKILALRMGDWKYIQVPEENDKRKHSKKAQLYNLKTDIGETYNVVDANPEIAKEMKKTLNEFIRDGKISK